MLTLLGCSATSKIEENLQHQNNVIKILSLGDSYTIGESVCEKCRFPEQLKNALQEKNTDKEFIIKVIAKTGWTTTNLINAINNENLSKGFDLVTLLIGVNNQFQRLPFSKFKNEFSILVDKAILTVQSSKSRLVVLSIPDYGYTPFGNGSETVSKDIEKYNNYIRDFCTRNNITFINITTITKTGLSNPKLVANDGLHPSTIAYTEFVKLLLPIVSQKLGL